MVALNRKILNWMLMDPPTGDHLELGLRLGLALTKLDGLTVVSVISTVLDDLADRAGVTSEEMIEYVKHVMEETKGGV